MIFWAIRYTNEEIIAKNAISVEDRLVYLHDFKTIFSEFVKKMISRVGKDSFEVAETTIKSSDEKEIQAKNYMYRYDEEALKIRLES